MADLRFFQVALNTVNMAATLRFYSDIFGFANAGGQAAWGDVMRVQGLDPAGQLLCWFMVGRHPRIQFEMFQHSAPDPRPQPADWSPADHGWVRVGIAVSDFDAVLARLADRAIALLGPIGQSHALRHCAVRDPFSGIIVEIWEDGPGLPGGSHPRDNGYDPQIMYVTSSVADIAAARHFYANILGLPILPLDTLHQPADEALWGLEGAAREGFVVDGGNGLVEIVEYTSPRGRHRPEGWLLSDQGFMNVGFFSTSTVVIQAIVDRLDADGTPPLWLTRGSGVLGAYILHRDREVELLSCPAEMQAHLGFTPLGPFGRSDLVQMIERTDLPATSP